MLIVLFAPEWQHPLIAGIRALGPLQVCREAECVCVCVYVCVFDQMFILLIYFL